MTPASDLRPAAAYHAPARIAGLLTLVAVVAACGPRDVPVRGTPQAIHPSPSALAQGTTTTAPAPVTVAPPPYTPRPNDGSTPIID